MKNKSQKLLSISVAIYLLMVSAAFGFNTWLMFNPRGDRLQADISDRVEKEVDRSYNRFFTQFNFAIFLIGTSVWILRQSVMNNLQTDFKKQFKEELEEDFKKELKKLKDDLAAQRRKDEIIQELHILVPRPDLFFQEQVKPETQVALKRLTAELEELKSSLNLGLTVEDYIKWGDGLYYSAWNGQPEAYNTWFNRNTKSRSLEDEQAIRYYEKAIVQYEEALFLQPDAYKAHLGMGNALRMSGQYGEAIESYKKASQDQNISHIAWVNKGLALRRLHNGKQGLEEGLKCLDEAIRIFPLYARAYYNQACYYARLNDVDNAIISLKKAYDLAPARCLEGAENDDDFCSLRDHKKFKEWVPSYGVNCTT